MNKDEQKAEQFIGSRGLSVERISKIERQTKTPDLKVLKDGRLAFYCEVKGVAEDEEFEQRLDSSPAGTPVAKGGKDTTLDRIERKIHEAAEQFRAVDPEHETLTVLVFCESRLVLRLGPLTRCADRLLLCRRRLSLPDLREILRR